MKTTALAMAITDSELSDEEASILESGGFSVSRATTPQLTDLSEGKVVWRTWGREGGWGPASEHPEPHDIPAYSLQPGRNMSDFAACRNSKRCRLREAFKSLVHLMGCKMSTRPRTIKESSRFFPPNRDSLMFSSASYSHFSLPAWCLVKPVAEPR